MAPEQRARNSAPGDGGPPEGGFARVVPELDVRDTEASLRFWCGLIGFRIAYDRPAAGFVFLEREGAQVMLCRINGEWLSGSLQPPFGRGINLQIAVSDLVPPLAALTAAGWPLFRPVEEKVYRIGSTEARSREFLVQDPDGYLLRLSQSLGRTAA
jgi:catechol 2,3-dioxygenase-like lactoylglutathione lyase family enzyme